jgi:hypothetical protein
LTSEKRKTAKIGYPTEPRGPSQAPTPLIQSSGLLTPQPRLDFPELLAQTEFGIGQEMFRDIHKKVLAKASRKIKFGASENPIRLRTPRIRLRREPLSQLTPMLGGMNVPVMFAHGEHLIAGLSFVLLAGGSSAICFLVGVVLYLSDKSKKRRIQIVGIVWFLAVLLSIVIAKVVDYFFNK